jgi:hypothetical protein
MLTLQQGNKERGNGTITESVELVQGTQWNPLVLLIYDKSKNTILENKFFEIMLKFNMVAEKKNKDPVNKCSLMLS